MEQLVCLTVRAIPQTETKVGYIDQTFEAWFQC